MDILFEISKDLDVCKKYVYRLFGLTIFDEFSSILFLYFHARSLNMCQSCD